MIRICAGALKGRRLTAPPGRSVRPTPAKVREALFAIIGERVLGATFLDGYAGSGAVGLEALSRGASFVTFVEKDREPMLAVQHNIRECGVGLQSEALEEPFEHALGALARESRRYSIAFLDPPYDEQELGRALDALAAAGVLEPGALVFGEHSARMAPPPAAGDLQLLRTRRYGDTALSEYSIR